MYVQSPQLYGFVYSYSGTEAPKLPRNSSILRPRRVSSCTLKTRVCVYLYSCMTKCGVLLPSPRSRVSGLGELCLSMIHLIVCGSIRAFAGINVIVLFVDK